MEAISADKNVVLLWFTNWIHSSELLSLHFLWLPCWIITKSAAGSNTQLSSPSFCGSGIWTSLDWNKAPSRSKADCVLIGRFNCRRLCFQAPQRGLCYCQICSLSPWNVALHFHWPSVVRGAFHIPPLRPLVCFAHILKGKTQDIHAEGTENILLFCLPLVTSLWLQPRQMRMIFGRRLNLYFHS